MTLKQVSVSFGFDIDLVIPELSYKSFRLLSLPIPCSGPAALTKKHKEQNRQAIMLVRLSNCFNACRLHAWM